jgi:hypothetical protein
MYNCELQKLFLKCYFFNEQLIINNDGVFLFFSVREVRRKMHECTNNIWYVFLKIRAFVQSIITSLTSYLL